MQRPGGRGSSRDHCARQRAERPDFFDAWSTAIQLAAIDMMMARLDESRLFRLARQWSGLRR